MEKHRPVIFARPGPFPWFVDAESDASPALGYLSSRSEQAEAVRCSAQPGVALIRQWHWTLAAIAGRGFADLPSPELRRLSASVREPSFSIHRLRRFSPIHRNPAVQISVDLWTCSDAPAGARRTSQPSTLNHQLRLVGPLMTLAGWEMRARFGAKSHGSVSVSSCGGEVVRTGVRIAE